ncbi:MAG: hypothetical protein AAGK97_08535, partial [Bacteroidota bacterium]
MIEPAPTAEFVNPPDDITITCDLIPVGVPDLNYTNSESGACLIEGFVSGIQDSDVNNCGGTITNIWTFIDACGRGIEHQQTITVEPPLEPTFIDVPADVTVTCENAPAGNPPDLAYTNNLTDNCEIAGTVSATIDGEVNACGGTIQYLWEYTDDCDRRIQAIQNITIEPAPEPVFTTLPQDITVSCVDIPSTPPTLDYTNSSSGNCLIEGSVDAQVDGNITACGGTLVFTWTFENDCYSISHVQNINVEPAPEANFLSLPQDVTVSCDDIPLASQLAYSNGSEGDCEISGNIPAIETGSYNGCGGQLTYLWEFTDDCGRTITHSRNIQVEPASQASFIDPPEDITITCNDVPLDPPSLAYTNNENGNCLIDGDVVALQTGSYNECGGLINYTWTFSDDCGRVISHMQALTIEPALDAVFLDLPEDMTIDCGSPFPDPIDLEYSNSEIGECEIGGLAIADIQVDGNISVYTWSFTNPCSNEEVTHQQTLTISQEPDIVVDQDIFNLCEGILFDLESIQVEDLNGTDPIITFHDDSPANSNNEILDTEVELLFNQSIYILASNDFGCSDEIEIEFNIEVPPFAGEDEFPILCFDEMFPVSLFDYLDPFADLDGTWEDVSGSGIDLSDPFFVDFRPLAGTVQNYQYIVESDGICPNDTV